MSAPEVGAPDAPQPARLEPIARLERLWLRTGIILLAVFVTIVVADALVNSTRHSHGSVSMAPEDVSKTPPFDKPGTFRNADGSWDAIVVAYAFGFLPREDLVVPVDVDVHFRVASSDVVHGFLIPGRTNVNLEVLPGHISEVTQRFHEPGRYLILCHEYCGSGHHFMTTHIRVLERGQDPDHPPALDGTPEANAGAAAAAMDHAGASADDEHGDHA